MRCKRRRGGRLREIWRDGPPRRSAPPLLFKEGSFYTPADFMGIPLLFKEGNSPGRFI
jgi:hypothetical protein